MAEEIAKAFEDMDRQRCRSGDEEPHAIADLAGDGRRSLQQANVHRRNTEEERRLEIEKLFSCRSMVEALEQSHPASAREPAVQAVAQRMDVEEREGEQKAIAVGDLPRFDEVRCVRREIVVREDGSLRRARRPGRVDDRRGRIAVEIRGRAFARYSADIRQVSLRDQGARLGIGNDVVDLAPAIENIDGDEKDAELHAGQKEIDQLDPILQVNAEAIAFAKAALPQRVRHPVAAFFNLAEGE